jgi:lysyl-tRNA synthetase class 2
MPQLDRKTIARSRARLYEVIRRYLSNLGFDEVETPCLVPAPGMEPHIQAFEVPFIPEMAAKRGSTLYLHTSPEYAMKRLLAEGFDRIFQIVRVFRNGEIASQHNPEFTMLEFYRAKADYTRIMDDLEGLVVETTRALRNKAELVVRGASCDASRGFERISFRDAILRGARLDLARCPDVPSLRAEAKRSGISLPEAPESWDDLVTRVLLDCVERDLGGERPAFLVDYPTSMASLSRLKAADPSVAERFELYVRGVEVANGFSELNDAVEQRKRLLQEQELRRRHGRSVYPLDERFLDGLSRMPPAAGVAVGLDRLLMMLVGAESIDEVLLFPAKDFLS